MMFYNIIAALTMLFSTFSSYSSQITAAKFKTQKASPKAPEEIAPSIPTTERMSPYFPRTKLQFPEDSRLLIVKKCNEIRENKPEIKHSNIPAQCDFLRKQRAILEDENTIAFLTKENAELRRNNLEIEAQSTELAKKIKEKTESETAKNNTKKTQEIFELQRQKAELEKAILIKKTEQEKKIEELKRKKIATAKKGPDSSAPITIKDCRFALKTLMEQHRTKEQSDLFHKLWIICTDINHQKLKSNSDVGPCLNRKNHVLLGTVNYNFRYIYYPCTRKISILRAAFSQLLTDTDKFMEKEKICSNACTYYKSKKPEFESISEDSSTDCSSHSSEMDTSSDHDLMPD